MSYYWSFNRNEERIKIREIIVGLLNHKDFILNSYVTVTDIKEKGEYNGKKKVDIGCRVVDHLYIASLLDGTLNIEKDVTKALEKYRDRVELNFHIEYVNNL